MIQGVVEMATKIPYSQLAIFVELHVNLTFTLSFVLSFAWTACAINQCAKKVVSDSPGLVDFAIGHLFEAGCLLTFSAFRRGPVRGGARVPRLNFTASYVAISEHSRVSYRNFNTNFFSSLPVRQSAFAATTRTEHTASIFSTFKPRVLRPL